MADSNVNSLTSNPLDGGSSNAFGGISGGSNSNTFDDGISFQGSSSSTTSGGDSLRQSPWGRLGEVGITDLGTLFSGVGSESGGGNPFANNPAAAQVLFGGDNQGGSPFSNLRTNIDKLVGNSTNGSNPTGGSAITSQSVDANTTSNITGGFGGSFSGGTTGNTSSINLGGAFGGGTSEIEIRSYTDTLVNSKLIEGGITPSFNIPSNQSGEGSIPSGISIGDGGTVSDETFSAIFGIPTADSFDQGGTSTSLNIPNNQTAGSQGTSNNLTGNNNFSFSDGKWQSTDGSTLDAGASGGFGAGSTGGAGGFDTAASGAGGFASFIGGGNSSTISADGKYAYNYERPLDERALTDTNNPFNQLVGVLGGDISALGDSNPFAGGSATGGDSASGGSNPFAGGSATGGNSASGSSNPFAGGSATGGDSAVAGNLPGNLPFGNTPPSLESGSNLPETGNGFPVPYNSNNWISDLQNLDGTNATGNSGQGNGNWLYGSNNTTDGNGNWNFGSGNTTNGNGNWNYGDGGKTDGNGNWGFGSDNTTNGNGNWNLGNNNDIVGNANRQTGSNNDILGSGNTANVSNSNLLGNRIEASGDGNTLIGNEGWNFSVSGELISLGSSTPSQAIGTDISGLLNSADLVTSAMSNPGYNNPNYDFSTIA